MLVSHNIPWIVLVALSTFILINAEQETGYSNYTDDGALPVCKSLGECWMIALDNEIDCDVTFVLYSDDGPSQRISAHKLVLKVRSPVFKAMFNETFPEAGKDEVDIRDIDVDTFRQMLRYIYSEQVHLTGSNVLKVLYAARKYIVVGLEELCHSYLSSQMTEYNVCSILSDSLVYRDEGLQHRCLEYIINHAKAVILSPGFLELSYPALLKVVQNRFLPYGIEFDLFNRSMEWARHKGANTDDAIRQMLGESINHIGFLTLTAQQFTAIAGNSHVLTSEEKNEIIFSIIGKDQQNIRNVAKLGLNTTSRIWHMKRFQTYLDGQYVVPGQTGESFQISVNKPLLLLGLSVYVGREGTNTGVHVAIEMKTANRRHQHNVGTQCSGTLTFNTTVTSFGSGRPQYVTFDEPVKLEINVLHVVHVTLNSTTETPVALNPLTNMRFAEMGIAVQVEIKQQLHRISGGNSHINYNGRYSGKVAGVLFQFIH